MEGEIYLVTNTINNKKYVGQALKIVGTKPQKWGTEKRWKSHLREAQLKVNENSPSWQKDRCVILNHAIRKYGVDNFTVERLCDCSLEEMDQIEIQYITKYNTLEPNGYNLKSGGKDSESTREKKRMMRIGQKHSEETKKKISQGQMGNRRTLNTRKREEDRDLPKYICRRRENNIVVGYYISGFPVGSDKKKIHSKSFRNSDDPDKAYKQAITYLQDLYKRYPSPREISLVNPIAKKTLVIEEEEIHKKSIKAEQKLLKEQEKAEKKLIKEKEKTEKKLIKEQEKAEKKFFKEKEKAEKRLLKEKEKTEKKFFKEKEKKEKAEKRLLKEKEKTEKKLIKEKEKTEKKLFKEKEKKEKKEKEKTEKKENEKAEQKLLKEQEKAEKKLIKEQEKAEKKLIKEKEKKEKAKKRLLKEKDKTEKAKKRLLKEKEKAEKKLIKEKEKAEKRLLKKEIDKKSPEPDKEIKLPPENVLENEKKNSSSLNFILTTSFRPQNFVPTALQNAVLKTDPNPPKIENPPKTHAPRRNKEKNKLYNLPKYISLHKDDDGIIIGFRIDKLKIIQKDGSYKLFRKVFTDPLSDMKEKNKQALECLDKIKNTYAILE